MLIDKIADLGGECQHYPKRYKDGDNNNEYLIDETYGRENRIQGEHNVQQNYLNNGSPQGNHLHLARFVIVAFELCVDFRRALTQQKQAPENQYQVTEAEVKITERDKRLFQPDDPAYSKQQSNPHQQSQENSQVAGLLLVSFRKAVSGN